MTDQNAAQHELSITRLIHASPEIVDKVWNLYIRVDDVEAIYAEFQRRGAPIDYTLYDAPSGFREFGVQDPDGHDIAVGQRIEHQRQGDG